MNPVGRLRCPSCHGRLTFGSGGAWSCSGCERIFPGADGVVDLSGDDNPVRPDGYRFWTPAGLPVRIQAAAADRWPAFAGDTIILGSVPFDVAETTTVSSLLVLDTGMDALLACQSQRASLVPDQTVTYAAVSDFGNAIGDAVADTVICTGLLSCVADVRAFLAMVHRVLKPGGRAAFVAPNRRYWQAMSSAMAEALVQLHAKERTWPNAQAPVLDVLANTRRLLLHAGDTGFLAGLREKHLFDAETLEDWSHEIGFATTEAIPLDPDPAGSETARLICQHAGAPDSFSEPFSALVGAVGQAGFDLLAWRDSSASIMLWLTKATGPRPRIFTGRRAPPSPGPLGRDAAVGGAEPRWSVELLARDTPDGIAVTLGGWCLCNVPVLWVRLTLAGIARHAPVWRSRPDVHEVLNGQGLYQPMSAICSGLDDQMLFPDVHAVDTACPFRLDVILANGITVTGAAPETLVMDQQMVVAH